MTERALRRALEKMYLTGGSRANTERWASAQASSLPNHAPPSPLQEGEQMGLPLASVLNQ